MRLLPLKRGGEFACGLEKSRMAALALYDKVAADTRWLTIFPPELDILVWAPSGDTASEISRRSEQIFRAAQGQNLHLAIFKYPARLLKSCWPSVRFDQEMVTCLRSCLLKPEHLDWVERIWEILQRIELD